jgi:hypothetical protein
MQLRCSKLFNKIILKRLPKRSKASQPLSKTLNFQPLGGKYTRKPQKLNTLRKFFVNAQQKPSMRA